MASVDEKVVSLEFDNKQFESAVSQTLQSLENLKDSLNFQGVGTKVASTFNQVQQSVNSIDFSKISSDLEQISNRFTTMGIAGMEAISTITRSAMSIGKNLWDRTFGQITSGGRRRAENLEMANFQLEGLGAKGKKLQDLMDNAVSKSVSGTAYGMDEAARVASQLYASEITNTEDLYQSLRAVAGVAAMTGSEYSRIGDIFTTVAGNGKLMSMQLMQMSSAGLNGASAIAKYLTSVSKGAKVTEKDVREMVTAGKIDFNTFSKAMTYSFGDQAAKANETFSGALSNMKAALSRIGADFYTPYLENMRNVFNSLREFFDKVHIAINPFIEVLNQIQTYLSKVFVKFANLGGLMNIFETFQIIFNDIGKVITRFSTAFQSVFGTKTAKQVAKIFNTITKGIKNFVNQFKLSHSVLDNVLAPLFKSLLTAVKTISTVLGPLVTGLFSLLTQAASKFVWIFERFVGGGLEALGRLAKEFGNFLKEITQTKSAQAILSGLAAMFNKLADVGYWLFIVFYRITTTIKWTVFEVAQTLIQTLTSVIQALVDLLPGAVSGVSSLIKGFLGIDESVSLFDLIIQKLNEFQSFLKSINSAIREFYRNNIRTFSDNFKAWRESEEVMSIIADMGQSLVDIFNSFWEIISDVASVIGNTLKSAFDAITSRFHKVNNEVEKSEKAFSVFDILTAGLKALQTVLKVISTVIKSVTTTVRNLYTLVIGRLVAAFNIARNAIGDFFGAIAQSDIFQDLSNAFQSFVTSIYGVGSFAETGLFQAFDAIRTFFSDLVSSNTISAAISKIKSFFSAVKDAIGTRTIAIFTTLGQVVSDVWNTIVTFFTELANRPEVQAFVQTIKDGIVNAFEVFGETLANGISAIGDFINALRGMDSISFSNILNALGGFKDRLAEFLDLESKIDAFKNFFEGFLGFIFGTTPAYGAESSGENVITEGFIDNWQNSLDVAESSLGLFDRFLQVIDDIKNNILGILGRIQTADLMALAVSGSMIKFMYDIGGVTKSFTDMMDSVSSYLKSKMPQKETKTDKFQKVVKSMMALIAVIVVALVVLSQLDTNSLMTSAGVLTGIVVVISTLAGALMIIESKCKITSGDSIGKTFMGMAGSILLIVVALKLLDDIELNGDFIAKLGILAGIFVAMGVLIGVLGKMKADFSTFKNIGVVTTFAGSLLIVILALRILQTVPLEGIEPRLGILAGIFIALGALVVVVGKLKLNARAIAGLAAVKGMAQALLLVVLALALLQFVTIDESLFAKLGVIAAILGMFAAVIVVLGKTKVDAKALKNLSGLRSMAIALLLVVAAIAILSLMDEEGMNKAMGIIARIALVFMGIIAVTSLSKEADKAGRMLLMMSGSLLIMVGALAILNNMDPESLKKSVAAISVITLMLSLLMVASSFTKEAEKSILAISLIFISLTACLGILSGLDPESFVPSAQALSILLAALTGCLIILSKVKVANPNDLLATVGAMNILSIVLIELAAIVALMSGIELSQDSITAIGIVAALLVEMTGIYAALATVAKFCDQVNPVTMIKIGAAFGAFVDVVVLIVGALVVLIGAINELSEGGLVDLLNSGAEVLSALGAAIGGFIGSIIGGVIGGIVGGAAAAMTSLVSIAVSLSNFMIALTPFTQGLQMIDPGMLTAVGILADAILKIIGAEILEAVANFITGGKDLSSFGEKVADFCQSLLTAIASTEDISDSDAEKIKKIAEIVQPFIDIAHNMEGTGGLLQSIMGEHDIGKFGASLAAMCIAFKAAAGAMKGLDTDALAPKFQGLREIISPFVEMSETLQAHDGVLQWWNGEKDFGTFGTQLAKLASQFNLASKSLEKVKDWDQLKTNFSNFKEVVKAFAELQGSLDPQGGVAGWWFGNKDFGTFGAGLEELASQLISVHNKLSEIQDINKIWQMVNLVKELVVAATDISDKEYNSYVLAGLMANLRDSIVGLCDGLKDANIDDVSNKVKNFTSTLIESLSNLDFDPNKITSITDSIKMVVDSINTTFSSELQGENAKNAMYAFMDGIMEAMNEKKETLISNANAIKDEVIAIMESLPEGSDLTALANRVTRALTMIKLNSQKGLSSTEKIYEKAGKNFLTALSKGLQNGSGLTSVYNAARNAAQKGVDGVTSMVSKFRTAGRNCGQGIADGAADKNIAVHNAFHTLGRKALEAFKKATDINSPSKEFMKLSAFNVAGIVKGAVQNSKKAEAAYYDLGKESVQSAQAGMMSTSLTPVLDFNSSDVATLQSISSGSYNIGANVNTRFLNGSIENLTYATRKSNEKVVSAVNGLRDIIRDSVGDTYNSINGDFTSNSAVTNYAEGLVRSLMIESRI